MDQAQRRSLGAFYTPTDAATLMATWALQGQGLTILEPSFGDGAFIRALQEVAGAIGADCALVGVEIDRQTCDSSGPWNARDRPICGDFHSVSPFPVDAVVGNPPFVRYRNLPPDQAERAVACAAQAMGGRVERNGSTWMSIAVHATRFLRPGGRMALVLPADALYVRYALPFWRHLIQGFQRVRVLRCRERLFPEIFQDVVLLLASEAGGAAAGIEFEVYQTRGQLVAGQAQFTTLVRPCEIQGKSKPFTRALAGPDLTDWTAEVGERLVHAGKVVKFNIGYVAGDKEFFHPSQEAVAGFQLPAHSLVRTLRNSRSLRGRGLWTSRTLGETQSLLWLPDPARLAPGERAYIAAGEAVGVHLGYKSRSREPWFVVPDVRQPDIVLSVFGNLPALMLNDGALVASNSLLLGFQRPDQLVPIPNLAVAWYSSVGRLGVELAIHSLGGGVLVAVPSEADAVAIPDPAGLAADASTLADLDRALLAGDVAGAYRVGDGQLLRAGWTPVQLRTAARLADELRAWRQR